MNEVLPEIHACSLTSKHLKNERDRKPQEGSQSSVQAADPQVVQSFEKR